MQSNLVSPIVWYETHSLGGASFIQSLCDMQASPLIKYSYTHFLGGQEKRHAYIVVAKHGVCLLHKHQYIEITISFASRKRTTWKKYASNICT